MVLQRAYHQNSAVKKGVEMFSDRKLFLNGPIPGSKKLFTRLTSPIPPIEADPQAECAAGEIPCGGFRLIKGTSSQKVKTALKLLNHSLKNVSGPTLPLEIRIDSPEGRSKEHSFRITEKKVLIKAATPFGAVRALYRIRSRFVLRKAPFLRTGSWNSKNALDPALAHLIFKDDSLFKLGPKEAYSKNYLQRVAAAGYTGFHINVDLSIFTKSSLLPQMTHPEAEKHLAELQWIVETAGEFGLEVYLSLYLQPLKGEHPVFQAHPEIRGSSIVNTDNLYVLCTSQTLSRKFYAEQMEHLFTEIPALGGILAIAGCEGWLHCHTANMPDTCPNCRGKDIEKETALMFNESAAAVKRVAPEAKFIVWNYNIFAWTDKGGERFVSNLSKDCCVMSNFETDESFEVEGASGMVYDYSVRNIGPSKPTLKQRETALKNGIPFLAKCESGTSLECYSISYLPVMTRWQKKFERIVKYASGALMNWKFVGFNDEGLSQAAAGMTAMGESEDLLRRMAVSEFGEAHADNVLAAWELFDWSMEHHPFSNQTSGYFKGPFYIGPAQPLFLNPPKSAPEIFERSGHRALWITDLSFVHPFGVKAFLKTTRKMLKYWDEGCELLKDVPGKHAAIARLYRSFLRNGINMTEFYEIRDSFHYAPYSAEQMRSKLLEMKEIALRELENAKEALEILQEYPELAFNYTYRYGISEEMLLWKIQHTENLISRELPMKFYGELFGFHRRPRWEIREEEELV